MIPAGFFLGSLVLAVLFLPPLKSLLKHPALSRENYAGKEIPTAGGLLFLPVSLAVFAAWALLVQPFPDLAAPSRIPALLLILGMCFLGILDDLLGDRRERGFKGHILAALKGRLTTGFLKAAGGLLVALVASSFFSPRTWELVLNAVIIALTANLFNLLDMRPGRALKVFFPLVAVAIVLNRGDWTVYIPEVLSVTAVAIVLFPGDLTEKFMLGDAGSNVIGAMVGMGLALGLGNWWRLGVLILLVLLNLLSERYSFTRIIESNRVLRWMDMLGRKGENPRQAKYNKR